jgi:hypothetical protein
MRAQRLSMQSSEPHLPLLHGHGGHTKFSVTSVSVRIVLTQSLLSRLERCRHPRVFERHAIDRHCCDTPSRQEYPVHPSAVEACYHIVPVRTWNFAHNGKFVCRVRHDASPEMIDHGATTLPASEVSLHVVVKVRSYFRDQSRVVPVVVPQITVLREGPFPPTYDYTTIWSGIQIVDPSSGSIFDVIRVG